MKNAARERPARENTSERTPLPPGNAPTARVVEATLETLLSRLRLQSAFYFSVSAAAPWATLTPHMRNIGSIVMPEAHTILPFHIMLDGDAWCWRAAAPADKRRFRTGDVLVLPRGCDHVIASGQAPGAVPAPDVEVYREAEASGRPCTHVDLGGAGPKADFVCGYFGAPNLSLHPLFTALPDLLVLTPTPEKWRLLRRLVAIATEQQADRVAGGALVAARLAETMFVDALHQHLGAAGPAGETGWLSALLDPQIGPALAAIHHEPQARWTAETLAARAGLSRSAFMERFAAAVGASPIQYLQRCRLQIGAELLAETDQSIRCVAEACGYGSEAAFHRAFKRRAGMTPGAWRALHGG